MSQALLMDGDFASHGVSGSPLLTLTLSFRGTAMGWKGLGRSVEYLDFLLSLEMLPGP